MLKEIGAVRSSGRQVGDALETARSQRGRPGRGGYSVFAQLRHSSLTPVQGLENQVSVPATGPGNFYRLVLQ